MTSHTTKNNLTFWTWNMSLWKENHLANLYCGFHVNCWGCNLLIPLSTLKHHVTRTSWQHDNPWAIRSTWKILTNVTNQHSYRTPFLVHFVLHVWWRTPNHVVFCISYMDGNVDPSTLEPIRLWNVHFIHKRFFFFIMSSSGLLHVVLKVIPYSDVFGI